MLQDDIGWSPLMISASVPESEPVLKLLIQRGADINLKSEIPTPKFKRKGLTMHP